MSNSTETKFGYPATLVAQTSHWTVLLRPAQPTLGALVLVCREPAEAFSELSPAAYVDLRAAVRRVERALKEVVDYARINYLMLMMVDRDVHFHVLPRYEGARTWLGHACPDAGWPGPPALDATTTLDAVAREALVERLRAAWEAAED